MNQKTQKYNINQRKYGARVGAQSGLGPGPGWGPYGPMWALMGPPGQVLEKTLTFRQLSVETFGPISHDSGPKLKNL